MVAKLVVELGPMVTPPFPRRPKPEELFVTVWQKGLLQHQQVPECYLQHQEHQRRAELGHTWLYRQPDIE
jgi:hypothetical protein